MSHAPAASAGLFEGIKTIVEPALMRSLERLSPDCPERLRDAMSYSLMAGGKRLRPALVFLACEAVGGDPDRALPGACAIEMVHTYSLIHDDLPAMDDDDLRRGKPTCHKQFDEATAILAGDALLTLAFELIANEISPGEVAVACCVDLASGAGPVGMVGGQMADLEGETSGIDDLTQLESIHRRKTGRLILAALTMGGRIAGATQVQLSALNQYGKAVGLAFQIADDLLDVGGEAERMGKAVRKDAYHSKMTYPALMGVEESQARAQSLVAEALQAIEPFGDRGERLAALAHFIIARDH